MTRNEVLQIRISPALRDRLQRLRNERHVNISAWLRDLISAALDREFPPPADPSAPSARPATRSLAGIRTISRRRIGGQSSRAIPPACPPS